MAEYNDWLVANGYTRLFTSDGEAFKDFETPPLSSYETYSDETLEGLVDSDGYAGMILGKRYLKAGRLEEAEPLLVESTINGYASAIDDLRHLYSRRSRALKEQEDKFEDVYANLVESYAWRNVMKLRFFPDKQVGRVHEGWVRREFDEQLRSRLFEDAIERSTVIFGQLEEARRVRGLAEFDTYHPESALRRVAP